MNTEDQQLDQISKKISELIALKNQKQAEIESLLEENKSLKKRNESIGESEIKPRDGSREFENN